jgi:hypothetical protein
MISCHHRQRFDYGLANLPKRNKIPPGRETLKENWQAQLRNAMAGLIAAKSDAIVYFTRRDLLGEAVNSIHTVWEFSEPRRILRQQSPNGSWAGAVKKTPVVYPPDHASLVATFKAFRTLVERYQFTRESTPLKNAAEYLWTFQTPAGDIRGFIGNQYATYYTGDVLGLLMRAGYMDDPRVENGLQWLLKMRQNDGGWTIPILTQHFDCQTMYRLTSSYAEPVEPDRTQPFSHNWTDMVLRAFAVHPVYRHSKEARLAGRLLKSCFFQPDAYSSYQAASYWARFIFWWPNLLTAMESLALQGFSPDDTDNNKGLQWFFDHQKEDGLWDCAYDGKSGAPGRSNATERAWVSLRICRLIKQFLGQEFVVK